MGAYVRRSGAGRNRVGRRSKEHVDNTVSCQEEEEEEEEEGGACARVLADKRNSPGHPVFEIWMGSRFERFPDKKPNPQTIMAWLNMRGAAWPAAQLRSARAMDTREARSKLVESQRKLAAQFAAASLLSRQYSIPPKRVVFSLDAAGFATRAPCPMGRTRRSEHDAATRVTPPLT